MVTKLKENFQKQLLIFTEDESPLPIDLDNSLVSYRSEADIYGLQQDSSISIAYTMEILQSST